jgi:hypothetical protein
VLIYKGPNLSKNFYHLYFTLCQILGRWWVHGAR